MALYKYSYGPKLSMSQNVFYENLAEELIENKFNNISRRSVYASDCEDGEPKGVLSGGVGTHLAVTEKRRKPSNGNVTNAAHQERCRICKISKSKFLCSKMGLVKFTSAMFAQISVSILFIYAKNIKWS